jgi:hypothetical protein
MSLAHAAYTLSGMWKPVGSAMEDGTTRE